MKECNALYARPKGTSQQSETQQRIGGARANFMWDTLIVPRWDVHVISGIRCPMSMIFSTFIYYSLIFLNLSKWWKFVSLKKILLNS
jgi:hypothetical protein